MPPPRAFMPSIWPGSLLSASDVSRFISTAQITPLSETSPQIAADILNRALQQFLTLAQGTDSAGELKQYFHNVARRTADLIAELRNDDHENPFAQASTAFILFPEAWEETGFDPADLDEMVARLEALKMAAQNAGNQISPKTKTARKDLPALAAGLNSAYAALTGKGRGDYSNPPGGDGGAASGRFITFAQVALVEMATRLESSEGENLQAEVAELRRIAASANVIVRFRRASA